jgi:hypothetical protein
MKELMQRFNSFISFSSPVDADYISTKFDSIHRQNQIEAPHWSTKATRQQLIATYWFGNVLGHFVLILSLSILMTDLIQRNFVFVKPGVILLVGMLTFPILLISHYWPNYHYTFLPRLETAIESYEYGWQKHMDDCKKAQWQNLTLILIAYALAGTSGINSLQPTDRYAGLLAKLFGVDPGSLKNHLELLMGPSSARKDLIKRKRTEVSNRFSEAYQFLEDLQLPAGIQVLKDLEGKVFSS